MVDRDPEKCIGHKGPAHVVWNQPVTVTAGAGMEDTTIPSGAIIIDLASQYLPAFEMLGCEVPDLIRPRVRISWPDGSTPQVSAHQWQVLAAWLVKRGGSVYVACGMGHGRTGTCLSILAHYMRVLPPRVDPVKWVREHYCPNAVETKGQIEYVAKMTGRPVTAEPSGICVSSGTWNEYWSGTSTTHYFYGDEYEPDHVERGFLDCPVDCKYATSKHQGCHKYGHVPMDEEKKRGAVVTDKPKTQPLLPNMPVDCVAQTWDEVYSFDHSHYKDGWEVDRLHKCRHNPNHNGDHACLCGYTWAPWTCDARRRLNTDTHEHTCKLHRIHLKPKGARASFDDQYHHCPCGLRWCLERDKEVLSDGQDKPE